MIREIELLAPGGDVDSIKAAIAAGADAVYCGLNRFNARNRAGNISFDELQGILRLARNNHCKVFLTLNIVFLESEIPALFQLLNKLVNTRIDGLIVQDLGLLYLISRYFNSFLVHASTQLTTHNQGQVKFLSELSVSRINLSRELNIREIKVLSSVARDLSIQTEVFVHGSYCISFSGICYMSSLHSGNSGNRGRCSQPCRDSYETTLAGKNFPLNLKDNSAYHDLEELADAGVTSLKIEGRIKKFDYVYTVVKTWRDRLNAFYNQQKEPDNSDLYKVFNRDFSNSFLTGEINKDMFIDNPRDNSIASGQKGLYEDQSEIRRKVEEIIGHSSIVKAALRISISGKRGQGLEVVINTPDESFVFISETELLDTGREALSIDMLIKKFKALNDTEYYIDNMDLDALDEGLYLPFKELTSIKRRILFRLIGSRDAMDPVPVPVIEPAPKPGSTPTLSVLISSESDVALCDEIDSEIFFKLPSGINKEFSALLEIFRNNKQLIPWFPSILIGDDYDAAVSLLHELATRLIVTDNTGIAYEAYKNRMPWIAGPYMNNTNSFSILCMKENFACYGAFLSNELNQHQIRNIKRPDNLNLYFSIYHPNLLMTSRQCLSHQIDGCEKTRIDGNCVSDCERSSSITSLEKGIMIIEKSRGNYHRVYNDINYLNTDIVNDIEGVFSSFLIDLSEVKTDTKVGRDKKDIINLFDNFIRKKSNSKNELEKAINPTNNTQYTKGL